MTTSSKKYPVSSREYKKLLEEARIKKVPLDIDLEWSKDLQGTDNILKLDPDLLYISVDPTEGGVLPPHLGNDE